MMANLSIIKCILFPKTKRPAKLNISYGDHIINQSEHMSEAAVRICSSK